MSGNVIGAVVVADMINFIFPGAIFLLITSIISSIFLKWKTAMWIYLVGILLLVVLQSIFPHYRTALSTWLHPAIFGVLLQWPMPKSDKIKNIPKKRKRR